MIPKSCTVSGQTFEITDEDLKFYEKMGVPSPTLCPEERQRRRLTWRNERQLYKRKCDATGKSIVSIYHPKSPFPVYEKEYWWSDKWEALSFGINFDFNKPFFEQFMEVHNRVPRMNLVIASNQDCEYVSMTGWSKRCYLTCEAERNEDCYYCGYTYDCKNCVDCDFIDFCELCYECNNCQNCYNSAFLRDSENCSDSAFLKHCIGCKNCFGCINIRNKEYYFLGEPLSKSDYHKKIKEILTGTHADLSHLGDAFSEFLRQSSHKHYIGKSNEDISGDYIKNSKNCFECFDIQDMRDSKFIFNGQKSKDCYDINLALQNSELIYDSNCLGHGAQNIRFSLLVWENVTNLDYCDTCMNSHDLFGCVGLRHQKLCILNKSYTTHEYETLKTKIIAHMKETGEWGEFFPISMSPFAYNETVAQEYFPLTREEAINRGYRWREEKELSPESQGVRTGNTTPVPDNITQVGDNITDQVLYCEVTGKPYKIQKAELKFYRKMNLPIPRLHPDIRHQERMKLRNPRQLWSRACGECQKDIQTTYAPTRPEKVLCEACYLKVVD